MRLPEGATVEVEELVRDGSLYRLLIDKFDMVPTEGLESVSAIAATAEDGALLGVKSGSPLLLCERVNLVRTARTDRILRNEVPAVLSLQDPDQKVEFGLRVV